MPIIRNAVFILYISFSAVTYASDWQYAGFVKSGQEDMYLFYDVEGIQRPSPSIAHYWTKAITKINLDRYVKKHKKSLIEKAADNISAGYVPKFYQLESIRAQYGSLETYRDAFIDISIYEIVANKHDVLMKMKLYSELDCGERRYRTLDVVFYNANGSVSKSGVSMPSSYQFVPPDSNAEWQSQLICSKH